MLAMILENRATTTMSRARRRPAGTRPLTTGEAQYIRAILEARTPNSIPVTVSEVFVTQKCRGYAHLGHPRIAARLADAGLVQVSCQARYDFLGDLMIDGQIHVTLTGRRAFRTGRVPLA